MALDVDEQSRLAAFSLDLQHLQDKLHALLVQPVDVPLFIKHANGSVTTRAGAELRGPVEPAPAPVKKPGA